ncbi:acid ceramidase-like protein, putative (macronuclear) [Tetrahymena thermophila SB210]|uniref:Acid ceramidase-like protein, putative n=1 Tax=Tetrahymena thermophila (strain SB210) TaxID=312017 RepID=I7ML49_TETTS|nr:acid ceramidase-like protein, putative [Tetrahymena thermophila SB210]EAS01169.1 acid ceramidase-like protein, putative [Tetrahymena thermophila SB210]|eukprot:XP_001021414.1 acid ceramidase-like protein, putative [Tetrahymena thermophila SB210]
MKKQLLLILLVCSLTFAAYQDCSGQVNNKPLLDIPPKLLKTVKNGEKYLVQDGNNTVYILNVFGSPYQMGYASGLLMAEEMKENISNMFQYIENELKDEILSNFKLPTFVIKLIQKANAMPLIRAALQWNYLVTLPYTNIRWQEEFQGISDASGIKLMDLIHLNLFPELTQAACTIVGAWSTASVDNVIRQLRALDWSPDAPVNRYPLITVYHSTEKGSNVFANIGFAGLIGSITAFSANGIAMSEKVWLPGSSVPYTYYGYPWMYVFRDTAQFSDNLQDAVKRIYDAKRTQRIHIGIGSLSDNSFFGIEYSEKIINIYNDKNYTYTPAHPQMDGIMFWDKHVQPSQNYCLGSILEDGYGKIDTEFLFRVVSGVHETGNAQVCVFDFVNQEIWVSYSFGDNENAYDRSPIRIQFGALFKAKSASEQGVY